MAEGAGCSGDAAWLTATGVPNVGVRMCGGYDNRATIVAPSSRVLDALRAEASDSAATTMSREAFVRFVCDAQGGSEEEAARAWEEEDDHIVVYA